MSETVQTRPQNTSLLRSSKLMLSRSFLRVPTCCSRRQRATTRLPTRPTHPGVATSPSTPPGLHLTGVTLDKNTTAYGLRRMAGSKYEYVKNFEIEDRLLPGCFIVVRIDGKGFTKFSDLHGFQKPNDKRALDLMDACAQAVMTEFADVRLAYGESDEYSFVLHRQADLYGRRSSKIVSLMTSCFSANYVRLWSQYLLDTPLQCTPMFDGRAVCYPDVATLRDYLTWRQVDTHINNQYNTVFWALIQQGGMTNTEAQAALKGTDAGAKNELLYSRLGINYNTLPEQFKKGSVIVREKQQQAVKVREDGSPVVRERQALCVSYVDIIKDSPFWTDRPKLLL